MSDAAQLLKDSTCTVSDAGPSRKKLAFEIPAEAVSEKLEDTMNVLSASAALPGFRPGHAPKRLLRKKFGEQLEGQAKSDLISAAYSKAIQDNELRVIGDPITDHLDELKLEEGKGLSFEVEVEIVPEFDLPALEGIAVKKPTFEVTDEMIQSEIDKLCVNEGTLESKDAPEAGDYLTGRGIMTTSDGKEIHNIDGCVVQAPTEEKGMILGVLVEDFKKQLGLPKPEETVTIKAKGPAQHEVEAVRDADLTVTFEVQRVDTIVPASTESLINLFGLESEDALRERLSERLGQFAERESQNQMRRQVAMHLLDNTEVPVPERMTDNQAERILQRRRMELMYRGENPMHVEERVAELRSASTEAAQRELKLLFILNRAAEELKVQVTEAEMNAQLIQTARNNNQRPEELRDQLARSGGFQQMHAQLLEHKTLDAILGKAEVTDVSGEEWDAFVSSQQDD